MVGEVQLGQVGEIIMGQSPPGETYNEHGDGLPFFQGVADFNYRHPTPRVFCTAPSRIALPGYILLSVRAPIGRVNIADRTCAIGRGLAIIRPKAQKDGRYLEFVLRMLEPTWHLIEGGGSVFGNATRRDLETLRIPWHENACERHAIAHILGTLDDKIELNRRMSQTLEGIARALFKAWFVDFEPVRAKLARRWQRGQSLPGLPAELYDLFPDRLVDSELGEIPEGWEVKSLDEIARFLNGLALQKYPPTGNCSLPVIKIAQLRAGHTNGADRASADIAPEYVVNDGDILFSWSGSLECVVWAGGKGALNQHLFKVLPNGYPRWLCYFGIHEHLEDFRHIAASKATTMGHIQRHHLSSAKLAVPSLDLLSVIDRYIFSFFEASWKQNLESRALAGLRDALLPKLIRGEMRVRDAERFLEQRGL
jgi:type I restriction enzyme S subunit